MSRASTSAALAVTGMPETGWEAYWYGSVEEIADPDKALARWLRA